MEDTDQKFISNINLPNVWVDSMRFGVRTDGLCSIMFAANLPEGKVEQVKMMTGQEQLKLFVDLICEKIDYYPKKKDLPKIKK